MRGLTIFGIIGFLAACDQPTSEAETALIGGIPTDQYESSGTVFYIEERDLPEVVQMANREDKQAVDRLVNHYTFSFVDDARANEQRLGWLKKAAELEIRGHTIDYLNILLKDRNVRCDELRYYLDRVKSSNPDEVPELEAHEGIRACQRNKG